MLPSSGQSEYCSTHFKITVLVFFSPQFSLEGEYIQLITASEEALSQGGHFIALRYNHMPLNTYT